MMQAPAKTATKQQPPKPSLNKNEKDQVKAIGPSDAGKKDRKASSFPIKPRPVAPKITVAQPVKKLQTASPVKIAAPAPPAKPTSPAKRAASPAKPTSPAKRAASPAKPTSPAKKAASPSPAKIAATTPSKTAAKVTKTSEPETPKATQAPKAKSPSSEQGSNPKAEAPDEGEDYQMLQSKATQPVESDKGTKKLSLKSKKSKSLRTGKSKTRKNKKRKGNAIEKEEYYHGLLPREDVKSMLNSDGDFLVRHTEVRGKKTYVISVKIEGQAKHIAIKETGNESRRMYTAGGATFETIGEVVRHHMDAPIETAVSQTLLKTAVPKADWELKHSQIELGEKLGEGAFGEVYRGKLKQDDKTVAVAVKSSRMSGLSKAEIGEMMKETRLMRKYEHPNIVMLYGVAAEQEPILIVMELVSGGSVQKYVQKNRTNLGFDQLTKLCLGAAKGLKYLHQQNCVHRDVAARNCLITEDNIVKISDFGLSFQGEEKQAEKHMKVPIKWLAPETLVSRIYSSSTDVWSFGVMMWEVFSFGMEPYPGMTSLEVQRELKAGYRMPASENMPEMVKKLMNKCWMEKPEERPNFTQIVSQLTGVCRSVYFKKDMNTAGSA